MTDAHETTDALIDAATLVSRTDPLGIITHVNQKFCEVSGWTAEEVIGQNHRILNSGVHTKAFWAEMYRQTVEERKVWNAVVTNKAKDGHLYYVDTYIRADFDASGTLTGFVSVRQDVSKIISVLNELDKKNTYLEHAAKILRHDMHSGINTYIPRGVSSLERRLTPAVIAELKLESPLRLLKDGLAHTQKVYRGVKEFTNLVKDGAKLEKAPCDLRASLLQYLTTTSYKDQVAVDWLPAKEVNEPLFCTAIDNLIRNGLKYNDSEFKMVAVFMVADQTLAIQDNGRGMTSEEFLRFSQPYTRKEGQRESGSGLGLSIALAILQEHGFSVTCHKQEQGTQLQVKLR